MLDTVTIEAIVDELARAEAQRTTVPLLTARFPDMTVEDSYAVQNLWRERGIAAGRRPVGRKIGLTSKVMQAATGISEPDYGVIFADMVYENGSIIEHGRFSNVRIEVELAFVLNDDLVGPNTTIFDVLRATEFVVPALEILSSRIEMKGRSIVDTISDNAAMGGMVYGGNPTPVGQLDLRWVSALLYRNETIEESGVAAAVLNHPATGVAWLANKLAQHGAGLEAGEIILAGSFTRPMWVDPGDTVTADYGALGDHRMPIQVEPTNLRDRIEGSAHVQVGMWVCSGSPIVAEICAGSGVDWLLIDTEHSPNGLESTLAQLQAVAAYPATPLVRAPIGDTVIIKQLLDLGAQNLLIPMVNSAAQAIELVRAVRYPPRGVRGVGSALARAARWNRIDGYLDRAGDLVSLFVQIETIEGVAAAAEIASVDGVDGIFVGPSDLAASMGLLGQQTHPDVRAAVRRTLAATIASGKAAGVNAFDAAMAREYIDAGAMFIAVGADVSLLARGSEALAEAFNPDAPGARRASY